MSDAAVLAAVLRAAMEATGAGRGRLVAAEAATERLIVVASGGAHGDWPEQLAGYVMATGQPQIVSRPGPPASSALCAPCLRDDEVVGALELADKAHGASFSIDDLEVASLLAGIAGAAIGDLPGAVAPDPAWLTGELGRLAVADPARYLVVAQLVQGLLRG